MSPVSKGVSRRGADKGTEVEMERVRGGENEVGGDEEGIMPVPLARNWAPDWAAIMAEKLPACAGGEKLALWKAWPCVPLMLWTEG